MAVLWLDVVGLLKQQNVRYSKMKAADILLVSLNSLNKIPLHFVVCSYWREIDKGSLTSAHHSLGFIYSVN